MGETVGVHGVRDNLHGEMHGMEVGVPIWAHLPFLLVNPDHSPLYDLLLFWGWKNLHKIGREEEQEWVR